MKRVVLTLLTLAIISSSVLAGQMEDKISYAITLYKSGEYSECIKNLNTIISQDGSYPVAYYYLGLCYAKTNNKTKAIQNYDKVISMNADKSLKSMAKAAKGFGDRQRNGISPIGQIGTFGKIPYRFFFFPNSSE